MKKLILFFVVLVSGCATGHTPYYDGCFDGMSGARNMMNTPAMAEPDLVDYYCRVIERNHNEQREHHGKNP